MKANYSINTIPLGEVVRDGTSTMFEVKVLCQLSLDGNPQAGELQAVIDRHPILSLATATSLHGVVRRYTDWAAGRRSSDTVLTQCELTTREPLAERRRALADLVGIGAIQPIAGKLFHSKDFDTLTHDHFVDVTAAMDEVRELTLGLHAMANARLKSARLGVGATAPDAAVEEAKWLGSCVQSAVLDLVGGRVTTADAVQMRNMVSASAKSQAIASARGKIERRLRANGTSKASRAAIAAEPPRPDDVNVLLQSSLKSELISRLCGFVTTWNAKCDNSLPSEEALVFELAPLPSMAHADISVNAVLPTAFFCGAHAHPAAFQDVKAGRYRRTGLAWLSDDDTMPIAARYRATSISAEHQFTKQVIIQSANMLGRADAAPRDPQAFFRNPIDTRGPDQLSHEASGIPDAQTSGVTFSAPVEDLVTPDELKADSPEDRIKKLPCLFMEDLWVGYRLDIRAKGATTFVSTHRVRQSVHLKSGAVLTGDTEDYFDREQRQDPKYEFSSTDLKVYRGMSEPQNRDYLLAAGIAPEELHAPQNAFYTVSTLSTSSATPLTFGRHYDYQLRLVFAGGCSIRIEERRSGERYAQTFPFYRCASLQAGDVWIPPEQRAANGGIPETLFVSATRPRIEFALMPQHLDLESARFHGMLFRDRTEPSRLKGWRIIKDFTKAFPTAPDGVDYFCDPDVHGIVITARIMNGAEPTAYVGSETVNGADCDLVEHRVIGPVTELYGDPGQWQLFRPIWITVVARKDQPPSLTHKGLLHGCRHVELCLPGAVEAELSFLPLYAADLEARHATNVASSAQLLSGDVVAPMLVPAVAMRTIRVAHAVGQCRWPPQLEPMQRGGSRLPAAGSLPTCARTVDRPSVAVLAANVAVDAPSSKQLWCEASWMDILDTSTQGQAYRMQPGKATSQGVNLVFQKKSPPSPSATQLKAAVNLPREATGFFGLQLVQSRVFLGQEPRPVGAKVDELTLPDERRRLLEVRASASPRFDNVPGIVSAGPATSGSRVFDVPSALSMTPLQVAYAVPLKRTLRDGSLRSAAFGMRVYLHARMFESGPGERAAIGCWPEQTVAGGPLLEVPKYVTQWGEDPLARGKLSVTKRMPRASDFVLLQEDAKVGERLDKSLYPPKAVGSAGGVIYRDAVALPPQGSAIPRLSLASFAVRYDSRQCLWYFDVTIDAEFFGWCGLALYRHQPHSLEGFELSQTAAWIYACTLYEEPFVVTRAGGALRVVVGPVYDKSVTFALDSTKFVNGVSANLASADVPFVELASRRIGNVRYFEGQVAASSANVSLVKLRAGHPMQSRPVVERGDQL